MAAVLVTGSARAWLFPIKTDEWITRPDAVSAPPMLHQTPRAVVRTTASSSAKCRMSQGGGSVGQRCTTGPMSGYEAETRSECAHCEALAALERDFPVAHAAELRRFLKKVYVHMHRCAHTHTDTRRHHVQCIHACVSHVRMRSVVSSILPLSAFSAACMHAYTNRSNSTWSQPVQTTPHICSGVESHLLMFSIRDLPLPSPRCRDGSGLKGRRATGGWEATTRGLFGCKEQCLILMLHLQTTMCLQRLACLMKIWTAQARNGRWLLWAHTHMARTHRLANTWACARALSHIHTNTHM